jgi:RimJ/RimL family protein N-acetyltransferase
MTTLEGEYLQLRLMPESDIRTLLKIYQGTPLYFDGLGDSAPRLTTDDVRAQWQAAQETPGRSLFGVYHIETGLMIGAVDIHVDAPEPGAATIWLLIWGGFQRQGYGQECMAMVEGWLNDEHSVDTLYAIAANNEEGRSFLHFQGFTPTGEDAVSPIGKGRAFWMRR